MTDGDNDPADATPPDAVADALGEALGDAGRRQGQGHGMSEGTHGVVTGDDDADFDLEACEIVAQTYDIEAGVGTRLYHVADDTYALSQYRRSVGQDWAETLLTHGELTVDPAPLDAATLAAAVADADAPALSEAQLDHVQTVYADACERAIEDALAARGTDDGPVLRGELACVEDHTWRDDLRPALADELADAQVDAVLEGLMDARPDTDWTWCQLYAVYVARLRFASSAESESA